MPVLFISSSSSA